MDLHSEACNRSSTTLNMAHITFILQLLDQHRIPIQHDRMDMYSWWSAKWWRTECESCVRMNPRPRDIRLQETWHPAQRPHRHSDKFHIHHHHHNSMSNEQHRAIFLSEPVALAVGRWSCSHCRIWMQDCYFWSLDYVCYCCLKDLDGHGYCCCRHAHSCCRYIAYCFEEILNLILLLLCRLLSFVMSFRSHRSVHNFMLHDGSLCKQYS